VGPRFVPKLDEQVNPLFARKLGTYAVMGNSKSLETLYEEFCCRMLPFTAGAALSQFLSFDLNLTVEKLSGGTSENFIERVLPGAKAVGADEAMCEAVPVPIAVVVHGCDQRGCSKLDDHFTIEKQTQKKGNIRVLSFNLQAISHFLNGKQHSG
jgi:hypothetical protein